MGRGENSRQERRCIGAVCRNYGACVGESCRHALWNLSRWVPWASIIMDRCHRWVGGWKSRSRNDLGLPGTFPLTFLVETGKIANGTHATMGYYNCHNCELIANCLNWDCTAMGMLWWTEFCSLVLSFHSALLNGHIQSITCVLTY